MLGWGIGGVGNIFDVDGEGMLEVLILPSLGTGTGENCSFVLGAGG